MKSTFRVLFYLRKNRLSKDGKANIMVRITINGELTQFNSKLDITPSLWDVKSGKVIGKSIEAKKVNDGLDYIKATIFLHYRHLSEKSDFITAEKVKNAVLGIQTSSYTLIGAFNLYIQGLKAQLHKTVTNTTLWNYERTSNRLQTFMKYKYNISDINLKEINYSFICDFETYLKSVYKYHQNTASKTIQRFKTIIIISRNNGKIQADPFAHYKLHFERTHRSYLTEQEIESIINTPMPNQHLERVKDLFLFSCFSGLSYIDIKNLKKKNIQTSFDGNLWIMGERHKTGMRYSIPLMDVPKMIIKKYENIMLYNNMVLPVISNQKMNAHLKEIATLCNIDKILTYHVARHSFATLTLSKGASIESVSKMLGHADISTTQIYARITDSKISNDMAICADKLKGLEKLYTTTQ